MRMRRKFTEAWVAAVEQVAGMLTLRTQTIGPQYNQSLHVHKNSLSKSFSVYTRKDPSMILMSDSGPPTFWSIRSGPSPKVN